MRSCRTTMDQINPLSDSLAHLPERKRQELAHILRVIFEEFDEWQRGKSEKKRLGKILKVILFGSYARGDWVEDLESGYRSDYDLLAVVNIHSAAEEDEIWLKIDDRLALEYSVKQTISAPAKVIAHDLAEVNDKLARGLPFFVDISEDGIALYEEPGHSLERPRALETKAIAAQAEIYFRHWLPTAVEFRHGASFYLSRGSLDLAAFSLHQAAERLYHCVLLVLTLYSPKSHRLKFLRSTAEGIEPRLIEAWPRDSRFARRCFERLDRAYVDARYSSHYEVTQEELDWLVDRITVLQVLVEKVCRERIAPDER
nr:nucleotidyltransferase [Rhizobium sp. Q54]